MTERPERNVSEPDTFALKIIEVQFNTIRAEIEQYMARMYDVLKISLATIPILSGALIALVADQQTWTMVTERPILLGLFCLLSPMFVVIATYLGTLGVAQFKAVTRAADYLKVHFEDYLFAPIVEQLDRERDSHIFRTANLKGFLFWENYLSQHGYEANDKRFRNDYDYDKHVMTAFLTLLCVSIGVISAICIAAFVVLIERAALVQGIKDTFDVLIVFSLFGFGSALIWALVSFVTFFRIIRGTGSLGSSIHGGLSS
ncbi:MAG: hypothetical protein AAGM84_03165 [Pseudomonadota bacterium]